MKKVNIFLIIGSILIIIGGFLFAANLIESYIIGKNTDGIMDQLNGEAMDPMLDYRKNPNMDMPIVTIEGRDYIGYVIIPSLGLELPVQSTWSYPNIGVSPARYKGSVYLNDMIILAHNYRSHFGSLHRINIGDTVSFKDMYDNIFDFVVEEKDELGSTEVEKMVSGNWDLTLFTCTLGGETRTTIRCRLVDESRK